MFVKSELKKERTKRGMCWKWVVEIMVMGWEKEQVLKLKNNMQVPCSKFCSEARAIYLPSGPVALLTSPNLATKLPLMPAYRAKFPCSSMPLFFLEIIILKMCVFCQFLIKHLASPPPTQGGTHQAMCLIPMESRSH
jgi:hypothetical protein